MGSERSIVADYLSVTFERDGESLVLRVSRPDMMTPGYCVWRDHYRVGEHEKTLVKIIASEKRLNRWFNKRCQAMLKAGWVEI